MKKNDLKEQVKQAERCKLELEKKMLVLQNEIYDYLRQAESDAAAANRYYGKIEEVYNEHFRNGLFRNEEASLEEKVLYLVLFSESPSDVLNLYRRIIEVEAVDHSLTQFIKYLKIREIL